MLSQHDFLSVEECQTIKTHLIALQKHWINRAGGMLPFFTLGAASYLDASDEDDSLYRQMAAQYNPILSTNFATLYEKLAKKLEELFKMPVSYAEEVALPGFHIFLAAKDFEQKGGATHFDLQFRKIKWPYRDIDFDHPMSFTMAVSLPQAGAGLDYWEMTYDDSMKLDREELHQFQKTQKPLYMPYSLGKLVVHHGLLMHQIAPGKELKRPDARMTLQGHGLIADGELRLYW